MSFFYYIGFFYIYILVTLDTKSLKTYLTNILKNI